MLGRKSILVLLCWVVLMLGGFKKSWAEDVATAIIPDTSSFHPVSCFSPGHGKKPTITVSTSGKRAVVYCNGKMSVKVECGGYNGGSHYTIREIGDRVQNEAGDMVTTNLTCD